MTDRTDGEHGDPWRCCPHDRPRVEVWGDWWCGPCLEWLIRRMSRGHVERRRVTMRRRADGRVVMVPYGRQ